MNVRVLNVEKSRGIRFDSVYYVAITVADSDINVPEIAETRQNINLYNKYIVVYVQIKTCS